MYLSPPGYEATTGKSYRLGTRKWSKWRCSKIVIALKMQGKDKDFERIVYLYKLTCSASGLLGKSYNCEPKTPINWVQSAPLRQRWVESSFPSPVAMPKHATRFPAIALES